MKDLSNTEFSFRYWGDNQEGIKWCAMGELFAAIYCGMDADRRVFAVVYFHKERWASARYVEGRWGVDRAEAFDSYGDAVNDCVTWRLGGA